MVGKSSYGSSDLVKSENQILRNPDFGGTTTLDKDNNSYHLSFASQSVEGILYDLILKLSYLKEKSNIIDESLFSEFTYQSKRVIYSSGELKLDLPYFKNEDKRGIVKDENIVTGGNNLFYKDENAVNKINGEYTGFGFINDKLSTAWSNKISPIYLPNNLSNSGNLDKSHFKFISSENNGIDYDSNIVSNLNNFNKWGIYKNQLDVDNEYFNDILPDNVIQYRFNSSGLSFDTPGQDDEAESINTKFVAELKDENEIQISGNLHKYIVTDLGEFVFDVEWTKSSFDKSKITFDGITLSISDDVYTPENINLISGHIWMIDDYSISSDGAGFKFKRSFTRTNPNNGNLSGIAYRPYINGFKLYGAHIPERYDMLTKIRAEEHITDQIHLTLSDEPFSYPKELNIDNQNNAEYILYSDNIYLIYWKPISIANNYLILKKLVLQI
jgi:hypothetical protein